MSSLFFEILLGKLLVFSSVVGCHFSLTLIWFACCKACLFIDFCRKAISRQWIGLPTAASGYIWLASLQLSPLVAVSSKRICKLIETQKICPPLVWHRGFKGAHGLEHLAPQRNSKMDLGKNFWIKVGIFQLRSSTHGTHFAQRYYFLWLPPRHTLKSISQCVDGEKCFSPCELPDCSAQQNTGCFLFKHFVLPDVLYNCISSCCYSVSCQAWADTKWKCNLELCT